MDTSRKHPRTLALLQDSLLLNRTNDRNSLGSWVAGTGAVDENISSISEESIAECRLEFNTFPVNSCSTIQTPVDFKAEDLPTPHINMPDEGEKTHGFSDQYIGDMVSQGKHFRIPIRRKCSYDCIQMSVIVTDNGGRLKKKYHVGEIQVFRKVKDTPAPTLEMVVGGRIRRIEFDSEKDQQEWYTKLQQEKVKVIRADEEKNNLNPGYGRLGKRANVKRKGLWKFRKNILEE